MKAARTVTKVMADRESKASRTLRLSTTPMVRTWRASRASKAPKAPRPIEENGGGTPRMNSERSEDM